VLRKQYGIFAALPAEVIQSKKIRIVSEGLQGKDSIAELCRREGINTNIYYRWSKEILEAGEKRMAGDTVRDATFDDVQDCLIMAFSKTTIANNQ
jgi:transposase